TVRDIVRAQKLLLESLHVTHLVAVAGPSYGGFQAFQWAVTYRGFMHGIVRVVTAPKYRSGAESAQQMVANFAKDPGWNGGWYYDTGGIPKTLAAARHDNPARYRHKENP